MSEDFDFIVVGGGSAGAVIASRLSEDPSCRVALIEAGERPPEISALPIAPPAMQLNPATDWMFTADPGKAGLGLNGRRVPVPRGKMLGGSSGINYMMYVRGHPGDFDAWAEGGATGWSYAEVLPYFSKSEGLAPSEDIVIDAAAHNSAGPLGVSVRDPILPAARQFVEAAVAAGIPKGDYNGRDRGGPAGVVSLTQYTTRDGRRSSTYQAFLAGEPEQRPNLTIITGAQATRVLLEGDGRTNSRDRRRIPHRRRRDGSRSCRQGGDPERRCDRLAAIAAAVRDRAAAGTRSRRRALSCRRAACRQAPAGSPDVPADLSRPGHRRDDERSGAGDGSRRAARARRTVARRSRRRCEPVSRTAGIEAGSRTAVRRVAGDRTRPRRLVAGRCGGLLFERPRRPARHDTEIICFLTGGNEDFQRTIMNLDTARFFDDPATRSHPTRKTCCCSPTRYCRTAVAKSSSTAPIPAPSRRSG